MAKRVGMGVIALVAVLVLAACQDWAQYMGDSAHDGVATGVTFVSTSNAGSLSETWTLPVGSPTSMPVVSGGQLYVASRVGLLIAASTDGTTDCSGTPVVCQPEWTASMSGLTMTTTPAVANSVVYEDFDSSSIPAGTLAAFDANGSTNCSGSPKVCQPLWTASATSYQGVAASGGVVYLDDVPTQQLEAFDANGVTNCAGTPAVCQPLWTASIGALGIPTVANGRVYVASSINGQNWVAVYDAAGNTGCSGSPKVCQPLWKAAMPYPGDGSVDVSGGRAFVETQSQLSNDPTLVAFDAGGATNCSGSPVVCQPLWTAHLGGAPQTNTPAVSGGRVYTASSSDPGAVEAFDAAGSAGCSGTPVVCLPLWYSAASTTSITWQSPMIVNGLVVDSGQIYDANGVLGCSTATVPICSPLWSVPGPGSATHLVQQAIDQNTLFISESDGAVHAFRIPAN